MPEPDPLAPPPDAPTAEAVAALLAPFASPRGQPAETRALIVKLIGGELIRDLLLFAPTGAVDRRLRVPIAETIDGQIATIEAEVDLHQPSAAPRAPYRVRLRDETGFLSLAYFRAKPEMLKRMLPVGQRRLVSGKVEVFNGERQMLHPDHVVDPARGEAPPPVEPVYPLTAGLPGRALARTIRLALEVLGPLPEWLLASTVAAHGWPTVPDALRRLHAPEDPADIAPESLFRTRLAYDELFARQCALRLRRARRRGLAGRAIVSPGDAPRRLLASLPFAPTAAQTRAVAQITADLAQPAPMLRLLQGDVGSGKTLVAALAMAGVAEAGVQSALMAPTDILARQHAAGLVPLLAAAGVRAAVLTGRDRGKERKAVLAGLASGAVQVVIGTHALFQDEVRFADLGFIVIDEQHRFGVSDRLRLVAKGGQPHVLVMSATPIPRTLALAAHGDMDLSILDEKPPGRAPIRTVAMPLTRAEDVADAIAGAAARGERAYWVCPLIAESEVVDLAAVQDRYEVLRERFGDGVEIVHGKMSPADRDAAMERFALGQSFLMVATTVIEVGVNVPEATIMVIEHAERFGLAQLHQLRGRVGRGERRGSCVLLWRPPLGELAKERLDTLRRTDDGFVIAEADYKLRGSGDVLGVQQSGLPPFRMLDPVVHAELLAAADQEARLAVDQDPDLGGPRGQAVRAALALFGYDEGPATGRSG